MEEKTDLLCLSKDRDLLATRGRVLATRYKVVAVDSLHQMTELPLSSVLVLCHTLSEAECMTALRIAKACWPEIKVVFLTKYGSSPINLEGDAFVESLSGPEVLLKTISTVLPEVARAS